MSDRPVPWLWEALELSMQGRAPLWMGYEHPHGHRQEEVGRDVSPWRQLRQSVQRLNGLLICHLGSTNMPPRI